MDPKIVKELSQREITPFHASLLEDTKALVKLSRDAMSKLYDRWDKADELYRGYRTPDREDKKSKEKGEPEKMVVPVGYAQVQTFVSFCFSLYTQREKFFELLPMDEGSHKAAKVGEALLSRDLSYNQFESILQQFLLGVGKYGIGITKSMWVRETQWVNQVLPEQVRALLGTQYALPGTTQKVEEVRYLGNKLFSVSPYRFFPDTRLPLFRFQEGEFVATEDEFAYAVLKQLQTAGEIVGLEFVDAFVLTKLESDRRGRFSDNLALADRTTPSTKGTYIFTEVQRNIIPSEYLVDGKPLGEEDYPVKYLIGILNDQRIVKFQPLGYLHGDFTYDVGLFDPDPFQLVGMSLLDTIDLLQSTLTWFINSRITNVRKVIQNRLVVDPTLVEWKDLVEQNPVIRLQKGMGGRGAEKAVFQLPIQDVTTNHLTDAKYLQDMIQLTTGISESLLGQFHGGRRSATEARNVASGAAARLKMVAMLLFRTALEPMGRKMLSNLRDGLDTPTLVKIVGLGPAMEGAEFLRVNKNDLVGDFDFEVFDGTLPSEKAFVANTLEQVLLGLLKNPEAAVALGIDPRALLLESLELRGVRNPERFTLRQPNPSLNGQQTNTTPSEVGGTQPVPQPSGSSGLADVITGLEAGIPTQG